MPGELENLLAHSRAAYRFAIQSLPLGETVPVSVNNFSFDTAAQIDSMIIEYGWAFFVRYEACLEHFLQKTHRLNLSRTKDLGMWLDDNGVIVSESYREGLAQYRKLRNMLHHDDGATSDAIDGEKREIHLYPKHMEDFHSLFVWVGERVEESKSKDRSGNDV